jgi:hypothetical protein
MWYGYVFGKGKEGNCLRSFPMKLILIAALAAAAVLIAVVLCIFCIRRKQRGMVYYRPGYPAYRPGQAPANGHNQQQAPPSQYPSSYPPTQPQQAYQGHYLPPAMPPTQNSSNRRNEAPPPPYPV